MSGVAYILDFHCTKRWKPALQPAIIYGAEQPQSTHTHVAQGYIPLVSLKTRQWICNLKMNGSVRCAAFTPSGNELLTLGGDGLVYTWDLRMRRCLHQFVDQGNVNPTALSLSPNGRYLATGSTAGVVNVYEREAGSGGWGAGAVEGLLAGAGAKAGASVLVPESKQRPIKELMNLTTTVDTLTFSPDTQVGGLRMRPHWLGAQSVHMWSLVCGHAHV